MKDASRQAEAPERVKGWRRWLRVPHVPTSVILTLLGIALTAWLLPAFTRQWDDRQKERELKAALVSDIASATAETLIATTKEARALNEQIDGEPVPFDPDRLDAVWLRNNVMLDAKLHAYFASSDVDAALRDYTTMMQRMVDVEMLRIFPDEYSLRPFGFPGRSKRERSLTSHRRLRTDGGNVWPAGSPG
jgi:hypothetical protein